MMTPLLEMRKLRKLHLTKKMESLLCLGQIMIVVGLGLLYLAIAKNFEPLLLLPIGLEGGGAPW